MARQIKGLVWGLFALRLGLAIFLLLSAIEKINNPKIWMLYFYRYYLLDVSPLLVIVMGAVELAFSLMFMVGIYRNFIYGVAMLLQLIAVIAVQESLVSFVSDSSFFGLIPLIFAFLALFVMRHHDTKWTLSKKPAMFS